MPYFGIPIRNGLPIGLGSVAGFGVAPAFSPSVLFAAGEQGAWYDPSDYGPTGTLFQDAAGTTPTVMETRARLMLDKSKGGLGSIGADIVVNGDFSSGAAWTLSAGGGGSAVISSGTLTLSGGSAAFPNATQSGILASGRLYKIVLVVSTAPAAIGALSIRVGGSTTNGPTNITAAGTYTFYVTADGADLRFLRNSGYTDTVVIDGVSAQLVPGNHATAPSDASSPILRARYNLLLNTEFAGAVAGTPGTPPTNWSSAFNGGTLSIPVAGQINISVSNARQFLTQAFTAAANTSYSCGALVVQNSGLAISSILGFTSAPAGSSVSYFINGASVASSAVPAANDRIEIRLAVAATSGTPLWRLGAGAGDVDTGNVTFSQPDVRLTSDAALNIPAYQSITTATSYDTAGFPPYLAFDGTDDSFSTASIDFTGTPQMTVFAGVTKLSDAAVGMLVELSAEVGSNNNSFYLAAPDSTANLSYAFLGRGTAASSVNQRASTPLATYPAPVTNVLATTGDIAGDLNTIRVNGVSGTSATGDQGAGNYGNYPLFIGRRNNTNLPFNGRIYSLIIRGAATTTPLIASTESWVAGKMRLPI